MRLATVIEGEHVHDNGSGAKRGALRRLRSHAPDQPDDHDLQPAACRACRQVHIHPAVLLCRADDVITGEQRQPGEVLEFADGVEHPPRDILVGGLDGRGGLAAGDETVALLTFLNEDGLRRR